MEIRNLPWWAEFAPINRAARRREKNSREQGKWQGREKKDEFLMEGKYKLPVKTMALALIVPVRTHDHYRVQAARLHQ